MKTTLGYGFNNYKSLYNGIYADEDEFNKLKSIVLSKLQGDIRNIWTLCDEWLESCEKLVDYTKTSEKDYLGLLRATGFAFAPSIHIIFAAIHSLMLFVTVATAIWTLTAIIIAIRQALDYKTTFRAIGAVLISIVVQAVILLFLTIVIGGQ